MYKNSHDEIIYSASDLVLQMTSPFASWMTRLQLDNPDKLEGIEKDQDELMGLLATKGNEHEARFLQILKIKYGAENVTEITSARKNAVEATKNAMKLGAKVIFQAYLERDDFAGYADFLVRREGSSDLGNYYYEAWDTKLAKSTKPYFMVQLCCYSWMLEQVQGRLPEEIAVVLGDNTEERFPIVAYYSYFQNLKTQFLTAQKEFTGEEDSMPDPALMSSYGAWGSYASQLMEASDSLALVAGIRKKQIQRLREAGVNSLTELATTELVKVKGIAASTYNKIKAQAEIQLSSRGQDKPAFKVIEDDNGKGLSALPAASRSDIFFDIEGSPLQDGGLEYLWGVSYHDQQAAQGTDYAYKDWWAHDQKQERRAFEGFIDWTYTRWQAASDLHVYHYASYEITAILKLSNRYQTRSAEVDEMLSAGVFVDLYKVVKNGLLIGEPKYSIKNVEHLYRDKRTTDVAGGGDSIVFYENWRESGGHNQWANNGYDHWLNAPDQFDWAEWSTLKEIRDYNIDDCESTLELAGWLREQQQNSGIKFSPIEPIIIEKEVTDKGGKNKEKRDALIARQIALVAQFENNPNHKADPTAQLLASLLQFHERERKPGSWAYYERQSKLSEELIDDDMVIFNITVTTKTLVGEKIHCIANYDQNQPIRTDKVKTALVQGSNVTANNVTFLEPGKQGGLVSFTIASDEEPVLQQAQLNLLGNETYIDTQGLENRLCEITEAYFNSGLLNDVTRAILERAAPGFTSAEPPLPVSRQHYPEDSDYINAITRTVQTLNSSCLCIQGPPGSGKTYTAEKVITALVNGGKRVGIMSNSHAAIMNLLKKLPEVLLETRHDARLVKVGYSPSKSNTAFHELYPKENYPNLDYRPNMKFTKNAPYEDYDVIGATVYGFANELAHEHPVDYLFVDEASQVALANLIVVSGAAKNIVLMGDQMQLEQPIQGAHPSPADSSALEFMLKGHKVIPAEYGVFLERTYRMHPAVCRPLSTAIYDGKLITDGDNAKQSINLPSPKLITQKSGVLPIAAIHEGNRQSSDEEVEVIEGLIAELKTGTYTDKTGTTSPITEQDILIVAPFNMQVNLLKKALGDDIKIGTIDKFQGQEAPVVIISMAVSDVTESSRGLDFVFDMNRLNVAVSRAKALAIVVANEGLDQCQVNSVAQMEKAGFFTYLTRGN
ncbi:hypothetical protein A9Q88_12980 [Gammaproteobacteria bacterium 50_400_T64]|nr:hypothetical protein A9Q88_12980 [Gammaproteobacteria bacterium 50_400_T64]